MPVPPPDVAEELLSAGRIERWASIARTLPPIVILSLLFAYVVIIIMPEQSRENRELIETQRKEFITALKDQDTRNNEALLFVENRCNGKIEENNKILLDIRQRLAELRR